MPDRSTDEETPDRAGVSPADDDPRFRSEVILALVERRGGAITVDELAQALSRRGPGNADPDPEFVGDVHQWLYRTELQRLSSGGELAFDADTGLVGPGGDYGIRTPGAADAATATRGDRWAVAYAVATAVAAGVFALAGGSVDPLGAVPRTAVLGAFVLACGGIAVTQHRAA